jgi:hypothetical protein
MSVDRPYPVDYEYRGVKAKIDFLWGADSDPAPTGLKITIQNDEGGITSIVEKHHFNNLEEAVIEGKALVVIEIDRISNSIHDD